MRQTGRDARNCQVRSFVNGGGICPDDMSITKRTPRMRLKYAPQAYLFISEALRVAQDELGRIGSGESDDDSAHISGPELLDGVRILGLKQFGMMAPVVFRSWGVTSTDDFGRIVFELIERGDMRKTERDQLADFCGVYDFEDAFQRNYQFDVSKAFKS